MCTIMKCKECDTIICPNYDKLCNNCKIMTKDEIQELHKKLSKARYFYYEKSELIMTDYEYDILEKDYDLQCEIYKVPIERRLSNFVGFSIAIPRQLFPQKE